MPTEQDLILEAEAELALEQQIQQNGPSPIIPFDGQTPETTEGKGLVANVLNFLTDSSFVAPFEGQRPVASEADVNNTKGLLGTGLEVGGSFLPAIRGAGMAKGLLGPLLTAGESALGASAGKIAGEQLGVSEPTTDQEKLTSLAGDTALGGVASGAADLIGTGMSKLGRAFNMPARIARFFGAKASDLNPEGAILVDKNIEELMQTSPEFESKVASRIGIGKAYEGAKDLKNRIGASLSKFYKSNATRSVPQSDLLLHPTYEKWLLELDGPLPESSKKVIRSVLEDFESTLGSLEEGFPINDLWKVRQDFDRKLVKGLFEKSGGDVTLKNEVLGDMADIFRDTLSKIAPEVKDLNQQYHLISPVVDTLGNAVAGAKRRGSVLERVPLSAIYKAGLIAGGSYVGGLPAAAAVTGVMGLGTNAARAGMMKGALLGEGINANLGGVSQAAIALSQTLPRTKEFYDSLPSLIEQGFIDEAEAEELQTAANSNEAVKSQVLAKFSSNHPELFEPSPLPGYNIIDGRMDDPYQRFSYAEELRKRERLEGADYTKHLNALNLDGSVLELQNEEAKPLTSGKVIGIKKAPSDSDDSKVMQGAKKQEYDY